MYLGIPFYSKLLKIFIKSVANCGSTIPKENTASITTPHAKRLSMSTKSTNAQTSRFPLASARFPLRGQNNSVFLSMPHPQLPG